MITKQVTRVGSYGIVICDSKILLTQKRSGPYCGLWGLPGGAIEFNESPEIALQREMLEETAYAANGLKLLYCTTSQIKYQSDATIIHLHQIGIIYSIDSIKHVYGRTPEEKLRWERPYDSSLSQLTPFAHKAISYLTQNISHKGKDTYPKGAVPEL